MADRITELPSTAADRIRKEGYAWFVDGENDDYLTTDVVKVTEEEVKYMAHIAEECHKLYEEALDYIASKDLWSSLDLPDSIIQLIKHDLKRNIPHVVGRMDLSGGIGGVPIKLIEYNADTCTIMPESAYFQKWQYEGVEDKYKGQFNYLIADITKMLRELKERFADRPATLLLCTLGYEEDRLNLNVIQEAAEAAGYAVDYADLQDVIFTDEGVFLKPHEDIEKYVQYHFVYKLVPWEIIMYDEPELMDILVDLSIRKDLIVLNPAYCIAFQAKHIMSFIYKLFPHHPFVLPTYNTEALLFGKQYVRKANFGRMGENIQIVDEMGDIIAETTGDFEDISVVYQEFAEMYKDEDGDIYQAGMYLTDGLASCLSFRRRDALIIDDESEFVGHVLY